MTQRQHLIDLMPQGIRARSQKVVRTGRYVTSGVVAAATITFLSIHARIGLRGAEAAYEDARRRADLVLAVESRGAALRARLEEIESERSRYRQIALPIRTSELIASIVNRIPEGMTLDRVDLDAGVRRVVRTARSARSRSTSAEEGAPRELTGEIAGFAPDDRSIAAFVAALQDLEPLTSVSLDFSRTRAVRGVLAREFRMSFRVDLETVYVSDADVEPVAVESDGEEREGEE